MERRADKVRDNIELDLLCHNQPESAPVMQEIYELVVETIQLRSPVLRLGNNLFPMAWCGNACCS